MMALYPAFSLDTCRCRNDLYTALTGHRLILAVYPNGELTTRNIKHRVKIVPMQVVLVGKSNAMA